MEHRAPDLKKQEDLLKPSSADPNTKVLDLVKLAKQVGSEWNSLSASEKQVSRLACVGVMSSSTNSYPIPTSATKRKPMQLEKSTSASWRSGRQL